jgi:hypothetical protein
MPGCGGAVLDERAHVELAAHERAPHAAEVLAIQPDGGGVVDPVQREPEASRAARGGRAELRAIPVVLLVQRLRDGEVVEAEVGIGIDAALDERRKDGAGHHGVEPAVRLEVGTRDEVAARVHLRSFDHAPAARERPLVGPARFEPRDVR